MLNTMFLLNLRFLWSMCGTDLSEQDYWQNSVALQLNIKSAPVSSVTGPALAGPARP